MVTRTEVIFTCDLCGTDQDVKTHSTSLDGRMIEVELCDKDWAAITLVVEPLVEVGRRPSPPPIHRRKRRARKTA